jgi:hypothetical protein
MMLICLTVFFLPTGGRGALLLALDFAGFSLDHVVVGFLSSWKEVQE